MPQHTKLTPDDYDALVELLQNRLSPSELNRIADRYGPRGNVPRENYTAELSRLSLAEAVSQLVRDAQNTRSMHVLLKAIAIVRPDLPDELPVSREELPRELRPRAAPDHAMPSPPVVPPPAHSAIVAYLTVEERDHLRDAFIETGVGYNRDQLLDGISRDFVRRFLPAVSADSLMQLDEDLRRLSGFGPLNDGTVPLVRWLRNGLRLFRGTQQYARFEEALNKVRIAPAPSTSPHKP